MPSGGVWYFGRREAFRSVSKSVRVELFSCAMSACARCDYSMTQSRPSTDGEARCAHHGTESVFLWKEVGLIYHRHISDGSKATVDGWQPACSIVIGRLLRDAEAGVWHLTAGRREAGVGVHDQRSAPRAVFVAALGGERRLHLPFTSCCFFFANVATIG